MFLDHARGRSGKLSYESRRQIMAFMNNPSVEAWDSISGIVIRWDETANGSVITNVWQALIALNRDWLKAASQAHWEPEGNWESLPPDRKWGEFPDPITAARAIKIATEQSRPREPGRKKRRP